MITFQGRQFDLPNKCDRCNQINDIVKLHGGQYAYFCDCFPLKSTKITPSIAKVYIWIMGNTWKFINVKSATYQKSTLITRVNNSSNKRIRRD